MGYNKFIIRGSDTPLLDLTGDTVSKSSLLKGITAHDKHGNKITGEAELLVSLPDETFIITENGTYDVSGINTIKVNIQSSQQDVG